MAKSKTRKGVKEKQAKAAKLKADAKKLQEHRIKQYVEEMMAQQEQEKNKVSDDVIEDAVIIEDDKDKTDETSI